MFKVFDFRNKKGSLVAAFSIFYFMQPYFMWSGILGSFFVSMAITVVMAYIFFRNKSINRDDIGLLLLFSFLFFLYTYLSDKNFFFLLTVLPFAILPFSNDNFAKQTFNNLLSIYCVLITFSLISWIGMLLGITPVTGSLEPLNPLKQYNYIKYICLISSPDDFRFHGVFDEPGVVGTLSGVMLCIQKCNLKDVRSIILLVSGLCSLSLFFYILLGAFLVLYYMGLKKNIMKTIAIVGLISISLSAIHSIPVVEEIIGSRLRLTEKGTLAGDNRTQDIYWEYFSRISGTHEFWFGLDDDESFRDITKGECSIFITILVFGVLLCGLYLVFIIMYGLRHKKNWSSFCLYLFVFLVCVYQRPFIFTAYFIFLWTYMARLDYTNNVPKPIPVTNRKN